MKNRKNVIHLLLLVLCVMTIGYAAFGTNLTVNGNANISSNWDVEITGITVKEIHGTASNGSAPIYSKTSASFNSLLTSPGDYIVYEVTVKNGGSIDARLDSMEISDEKNPAINFIIDGIQEDDVLNSSEEKKFTVKVAYNEDITSQPGVIDSSLAIILNYVQK